MPEYVFEKSNRANVINLQRLSRQALPLGGSLCYASRELEKPPVIYSERGKSSVDTQNRP